MTMLTEIILLTLLFLVAAAVATSLIHGLVTIVSMIYGKTHSWAVIWTAIFIEIFGFAAFALSVHTIVLISSRA